MTLVHVNETDSGNESLIVNLQLATRVDRRNLEKEQEKHRARVFLSDGGSVNLSA